METVHKKLLAEWNKEPKILASVSSALKQVKVITFKLIIIIDHRPQVSLLFTYIIVVFSGKVAVNESELRSNVVNTFVIPSVCWLCQRE